MELIKEIQKYGFKFAEIKISTWPGQNSNYIVVRIIHKATKEEVTCKGESENKAIEKALKKLRLRVDRTMEKLYRDIGELIIDLDITPCQLELPHLDCGETYSCEMCWQYAIDFADREKKWEG